MDERNVELMPIYSSTSTRPRYWLWPYALPGDSIVPSFDIHVIDIEARTNVKLAVPPQPTPMSGFAGMNGDDWVTVKWTQNGERLFVTRLRSRPQACPAAGGEPYDGSCRARSSRRTPRRPTSSSTCCAAAIPTGSSSATAARVIWFSERDGWAHLWLYDGAGNVKNRITGGEWTVGDVLHVDDRARTIWFTARGREADRNPYYRHLYRDQLRWQRADASHARGCRP
jgi:dipeptidyl-peptidase 4